MKSRKSQIFRKIRRKLRKKWKRPRRPSYERGSVRLHTSADRKHMSRNRRSTSSQNEKRQSKSTKIFRKGENQSFFLTMLPESESVRQTNDSRRERICYTAEWNSAKIKKTVHAQTAFLKLKAAVKKPTISNNRICRYFMEPLKMRQSIQKFCWPWF